MRQLQAQHMDGNGWSDVGYSFLVCNHGYVYEGRGLRRRNSANGNTALNEQDYAVCLLVGSSGLTKPTVEQLHGARDAIEYCRSQGPAGTWLGGHRDGYATTCPGAAVYAWVEKGAPRPGGGSTPAPAHEPFPGAEFFMNGSKPALGKSSPIFTAMGRRLVAVGCGRYTVGPGPTLGLADVDSYEAWQRKCGYSGAPAKWPPGKTTWARLKVPNS
ncbi:peptidoglycan-binding protein [Streptomyces lasiicapitis]|uniref:peptidoglycan-binding protein n=1 Tax=Streptomyces lasiicapitis TaxID=1923961 RepID=UPI0036949F8F